MVHDPLVALETLISLGFERVLTSGCDSSALEGLSLIKRLAEQVSDPCAPLGDRGCFLGIAWRQLLYGSPHSVRILMSRSACSSCLAWPKSVSPSPRGLDLEVSHSKD